MVATSYGGCLVFSSSSRMIPLSISAAFAVRMGPDAFHYCMKNQFTLQINGSLESDCFWLSSGEAASCLLEACVATNLEAIDVDCTEWSHGFRWIQMNFKLSIRVHPLLVRRLKGSRDIPGRYRVLQTTQLRATSSEDSQDMRLQQYSCSVAHPNVRTFWRLYLNILKIFHTFVYLKINSKLIAFLYVYRYFLCL